MEENTIFDDEGITQPTPEKTTKKGAKQAAEAPLKKGPAPVSAEKLKALQVAMDKIDKAYGRGSIMKLGDDNVEDIDVIPTGSIGLDFALGVGGYPRGRIIEIYGPESSGKTTLAIHAIAEAQKLGGIAAIIMLLLRIHGRKDFFAFGPFLIMGAVVAWLSQVLLWK